MNAASSGARLGLVAGLVIHGLVPCWDTCLSSGIACSSVLGFIHAEPSKMAHPSIRQPLFKPRQLSMRQCFTSAVLQCVFLDRSGALCTLPALERHHVAMPQRYMDWRLVNIKERLADHKTTVFAGTGGITPFANPEDIDLPRTATQLLLDGNPEVKGLRVFWGLIQ